MKFPRFNWFLLLRLAGIGLFIVVIARTDLRELWNWIRTVDATYLGIAIFFQLMVLLIKAWRWYNLNEDGFEMKKLARRSGEFFEGYAMGVITPGRLGELMKAGHAGSRTGILGAGLRVIAERGMDLSIFIVIAGMMAEKQAPGIIRKPGSCQGPCRLPCRARAGGDGLFSLTPGGTLMELFILAAVSLTIAVSLLLKKDKDAVQVSFALVCLALS